MYILEFHCKAVVSIYNKHVSVILQEIKYSTGTVVRRKLCSGFLFEESTVESPLALYFAKTWVGILS